MAFKRKMKRSKRGLKRRVRKKRSSHYGTSVVKSNVYRNKCWHLVAHPPRTSNYGPIPDIWDTTLKFTTMLTTPMNAITVASQYFTFCNNTLWAPFNTTPDVTNPFLPTSASGGSFVYVNNYAATDNFPFADQMSSMYQGYIVYDTNVILEVDITSIGDAIEFCLCPLQTETITTANNYKILSQSKHAVMTTMQAYGESGKRPFLSKRFSLNEALGTTQSINDLISQSYQSPTGVAPSVGRRLAYAVGFRTRDGATNVANVNIKISIINKVRFTAPIQRGNQV